MGKTLILPPTRFILLHYHVMKNGGTTIASILRREFGNSFEEVHGSSESSCIEPRELSAFLTAHPAVKAVSSHHIRYPLPQADNAVFFDCCFLRHPLDRLWSLYHFSRKLDAPPTLHEMAQTDFGRYLERLSDHHPELVCSPQTNLIANGGSFTRPPDDDDFRRAAKTIRTAAFPGVLERFDQSMVAAEYFLKPAFPALQLHYTMQNKSQTGVSLDARLQRIAAECSAAVLRQINQLNEHDLQLVHAASEEVQRRYHLVPKAEARLENFEARCRDFTSESGSSLSVATGNELAGQH